jgi:hypothetical protein
MASDDVTRQRLDAVRQLLAQAADELGSVLAAPAELSVERRVDLLWKVFGEVSNYDRHYSTVRSALTILLVSVGLAVASDPLKAVFSYAKPQDSPFCLQLGPAAFVIHGVLPFVPMLLIFALAIAINVYFQRLTASCEILEDEIERQIVTLSGGLGAAGLGAPEAPDPKAAGVSGYRFRRDLKSIYRHTSGWHMDAMKLLLLIGVAIFVAFAVAAAVLPCVWPAAPAPPSAAHPPPAA